MKLNRMITLCAVAVTLALSIGDAIAQNNNGGGNNGGGGFGNGGGRRIRGGNGGNFDPAQMQQQMQQRRLDNVRQQLDLTNDTDWSAIQPLVQKVLDAQQAARQGGGRGGFGGRQRGGNNGQNGNNNNANTNGGGRGGPQPSPEAQALQQAIDNDAPAAQLKDLLAKYNASQKTKQAALAKAQADLRQVLTVKQESQATLMGLFN